MVIFERHKGRVEESVSINTFDVDIGICFVIRFGNERADPMVSVIQIIASSREMSNADRIVVCRQLICGFAPTAMNRKSGKRKEAQCGHGTDSYRHDWIWVPRRVTDTMQTEEKFKSKAGWRRTENFVGSCWGFGRALDNTGHLGRENREWTEETVGKRA